MLDAVEGSMPAKLWRERLREAIAMDGRSSRSISLEAGMSPGYLHSVLSEGKDPTLTSLLAVCDVLGVKLAYIVHGYALNHGTERLIKAWSGLSPEAQKAVLADLDAIREPKVSEQSTPPSASKASRGRGPKASGRSRGTS